MQNKYFKKFLQSRTIGNRNKFKYRIEIEKEKNHSNQEQSERIWTYQFFQNCQLLKKQWDPFFSKLEKYQKQIRINEIPFPHKIDMNTEINGFEVYNNDCSKH